MMLVLLAVTLKNIPHGPVWVVGAADEIVCAQATSPQTLPAPPQLGSVPRVAHAFCVRMLQLPFGAQHAPAGGHDEQVVPAPRHTPWPALQSATLCVGQVASV